MQVKKVDNQTAFGIKYKGNWENGAREIFMNSPLGVAIEEKYGDKAIASYESRTLFMESTKKNVHNMFVTIKFPGKKHFSWENSSPDPTELVEHFKNDINKLSLDFVEKNSVTVRKMGLRGLCEKIVNTLHNACFGNVKE